VTLTEPTTAGATGRETPRTEPLPTVLHRGHRDGPRGNRWTLRRMFAVGATLTALLMTVAIVIGAITLGRLTEARTALLDDIGPAVRANQDLSLALVNQETGVRGFALTGDDSYLAPYREGVAAEATALVVLRDHLAGQPDTAARVAAVERAAQAWRSGYAEPVIAGGTGAGAPAPEVGKVLFDNLRAPSQELNTVLDAERLQARDALNGAAAALRWVGIGIALVMATFLALTAWGLRHGVLGPVSALAGQVRDVVSGDVRREVRGSGPREIVELGQDVDAMRAYVAREVDVLEEVNERLDEQARELERSNRDLEQFAYVASHDLQEPLRKVSSFCQLLQRRYGGELDDRAEQYIEFAVDGAQRMQRLINDLLAFSRVGRTTSGFEPVDLREIGLASAAQLETTRAELDGEIVVGDLPQVHGDPALLRQLLLNLVGNGLKFHRPGVPPVVRTEVRRVDELWEIAVVDNGIGVEPEYADKIFVIFQRLHGREVYAGTGIGLALAKKIVEFHGGRIWLDTTPRDEPGTAIRFTLPAEVPSDAVLGESAPNEQEQS
jgi:signal transduction histidine kinase